MRRVALLGGVVLVLLLGAMTLLVVAATAAIGDASGGERLLAVAVVLLVLVLGVWLVGRSVRRTLGPIGDVMEAADRVADGDYATRVEPRGPGEVRRLGRAFNEMAARLQANEDQRRRLLADVTHELRTPLSVVHGNLEGMADGVYEPDAERLGAVIEQTRVMARLLDDLQTLSTAEAGSLRLEREPTDLEALAADVVAAFGPRAAAAGVEVVTEADGVAVLEVDGVRIRQVLENLVTNALRHTPAGGRVAIRLAQVDDAVEIAVADTGPGIPAEQLETVFDRYARSADSGGTGLGLAIARSLVEAHRGSIRAESPPGGGATIRLRLPAG
jgi:two-component system, OmpR family, sensor histidine kinase BaeS